VGEGSVPEQECECRPKGLFGGLTLSLRSPGSLLVSFKVVMPFLACPKADERVDMSAFRTKRLLRSQGFCGKE
jgi:hypothetical protein